MVRRYAASPTRSTVTQREREVGQHGSSPSRCRKVTDRCFAPLTLHQYTPPVRRLGVRARDWMESLTATWEGTIIRALIATEKGAR